MYVQGKVTKYPPNESYISTLLRLSKEKKMLGGRGDFKAPASNRVKELMDINAEMMEGVTHIVATDDIRSLVTGSVP